MSVIKVRNSPPTRASSESTSTESSTLMQAKLPNFLGNCIHGPHTTTHWLPISNINPRCRHMKTVYRVVLKNLLSHDSANVGYWRLPWGPISKSQTLSFMLDSKESAPQGEHSLDLKIASRLIWKATQSSELDAQFQCPPQNPSH